MTSRVSGFVEALAQARAQAGIDPVIHFNTNIGFKLEEVGANEAWHELRTPQVIVNDRDRSGDRPFAMGPSERNVSVKGMADFVAFTQWLENASAQKNSIWSLAPAHLVWNRRRRIPGWRLKNRPMGLPTGRS
jgi:hypothetical protein